MSFCRACGEKSPDASLFCARCGYRLHPLIEEATSASDPHTTHVSPAEATTPLTQPLQAAPTHDGEEEERRIIPPVFPPELPATGNVPSVSGIPQVGTVPSIPGGAGSVATTLAAGTMAKVLVIVATCAAVIFAGIKVLPPILSHPTATPTISVPHAKATTVPMPPTQTSCPAAGTARRAITRPLLLGKDQNVVYIDNEHTSSSLERYDVKTGSTSEIFSAASQSIYEAQVSTDGQWIFFVAEGNGIATFQMIRMDRQGLQTLYCTQSQNLSDVQWSPDQASVAFAVIVTGTSLPETTISFLDLKTGQFRTLSTSQGPLSGCCVFLHWLDASHLAVIGSQGIIDIPDDGNLLLLDTSQTGGNLKSIFQPTVSAKNSIGQPCYDFTSSTDQTQLFFSQCSLTRFSPMASDAVVAQGPSSISVEPLTGGPLQTIYSNPALAITAMQTISQTKLLFYVCNFSSQQGQSVDASQNGLWTINTNGSGLKHLTTAMVEEPYYFFFGVPQPTWLVISRDGSMYATSRSDTSSGNQSLFFGSLNGGNPEMFLSRQFTYTSSGVLDGNINVVGWTIM